MIAESRGLTKAFMGKKAVKDVSLKIRSGSIYGLLGPNGSGKTTWMKMMTGFIKPTQGEVVFDGAPWNYRAKNQVAYMSTEPFYYDFMNIGMVGKYYSDFFEEFDQKKFHDLIAKVGLSEEMKMREISTGMMAKLKVIATLSRKAMLYMLDEPLNGIDLKAREEIIDVILTTVSEKNAVIISTHLIEEIESFIDHAIFMKDGSVIYECDVEEERMRSGRSAADLYRELM
ncbi:MAG TPA: ABC transporter ATP-binding protein [Candidatus Sellimonas avistercoris]|nr:ABC transporter ATP-binding protein [Candidatus Sellimonas avistercoris]